MGPRGADLRDLWAELGASAVSNATEPNALHEGAWSFALVDHRDSAEILRQQSEPWRSYEIIVTEKQQDIGDSIPSWKDHRHLDFNTAGSRNPAHEHSPHHGGTRIGADGDGDCHAV